jgi:alcohol dehydrogenase class IV
LFGGLALANAGLGAIHGFAAPIGSMFPQRTGGVRGAVTARHGREYPRLTDRALDDTAVRRYGEMGRLLAGRPAAEQTMSQWVEELVAELDSRLAAGIATRHINELVAITQAQAA